MSLLAWYPLLSNGNNQGLDDVDLSTMGTITYTTGKLGKSATFTGSAANCLHRAGFKLTDKFTWSCWFKINATTSTYQYILSEGRDVGSLGFNLGYYNSNISIWGYLNIATINTGTWYHVAVTVDSDDKVRAYLNGKLVASRAYFTPDYAQSSDRFVIGKMSYSYTVTNNYFPLNGQVCDVRIYDEVLSAKEIYEISKGLVLHYPFNSQYECGLTNKYSGEYADGSASYTEFTKTALTTERGYNYKLSYTGTGSSAWKWMRFPTFTFTAGKTYQYTCKVRINSNSGVVLGFRAARCVNDYATKVVNISEADGLWHEYSVYQTIPTSFTLGSSTVTSNPVLEFCTAAMTTSGTVYSIDFDLKDVQVVECDNYVPFIDNDMVSDTIADCSGFGYNSTGRNNIVLSNDAVKYNGSYKFNGSSHILFNNPMNSSMTDFTISAWVKLNATGRTETICTMRTAVGAGIAFFKLSTNQFRLDDGVQTTFTSYTHTSTDWTHVAVTRTASSKKLYINGELKQTATTVGDLSSIYTIGSIGASTVSGINFSNYTNGNISDFRIYSTALNDEDIKALYNTKFSVDNQGNFHCAEFVETMPNILFDAQRSLMDKSFSNGISSYVQTNCQVTLTDDGYRIYRPPNLTTSANGNTMWGGLKLQNPGHWVEKGHTYIVLFNVKGQSSNIVSSIGWTFNMGWGGDSALVPKPTNVSYSFIPSNFNDKKICYYKFTIEDDIYKVCKTAFSGFVAGTTYLSYKQFQFGFGYSSTGTLGTDLYLTNFRMYDITELENSKFNISGILECISTIEGNEKFSMGKYGEIYTNKINEL